MISFADLPFDGIEFKLSEKFDDLYRPEETKDPELEGIFNHLIEAEGSLLPVGSKVDLRGEFHTTISAICDRCTDPISIPVDGSLTTFLMAKTQFSPHDKPGGKVIHGPTRGLKPSRHHSKSKAPVLTDAEGEHDDENFGAFDGHTIDLRPLIRELLILQIPMKTLCAEDCQGLCLVCAGNINDGKCSCKKGPTRVKADESEPQKSELAIQLEKKRKTF